MDFLSGLFGGSSAGEADRAMAAKYAKLAETLKQKKEEIMLDRTDAETNLESLYTKFTSNADSAEGRIITDFDTHVVNWQTDYKTILSNIDAALTVLEGKISSAIGMKNGYEMQAAMKEAEVNRYGGL